MNEVDAAELLGRIAHVDRNASKPPTDLAIGWAALLDDIDLGEALAAVRDHYRRTSDTIAPADIVAGVRAARRDALEHAPVVTQAPDPGLMRRLEAIADAKSVERATGPVPLPTARRANADDVVQAAMRRGEQARRRQAELEAGASAEDAS